MILTSLFLLTRLLYIVCPGKSSDIHKFGFAGIIYECSKNVKNYRGDGMLFGMVGISLCGFLFLYLKVMGTGAFPEPLDRDRETELFARCRQGDSEARRELIEHNLRLVAHIIKKNYTSCKDQEDLLSVGTIGLIKAIDTFNPDNGTRFATYAGKCMQNEILMYFRSRKRVSCEASINDAIEFDKDGNPMTYLDILCVDDDIIDKIDIKCKGELAMKGIRVCLTARERDIIIARYGLSGEKPITQREVAKNLGISRSYVSRLEKSAIEKLREFMERPGNFL